MATIATINNGEGRTLVRQDFYLFQGLRQRVPVIGVTGQRPHAHHEAFLDRRGDADLGARFVPDPCLALGDTIDVRFMQGVDFTATLWGLVQQTRDQHQGVEVSFA